MKTLHLSIITILVTALTISVSAAVAQYGPGFYPPVHYPPTNDTKLELQVMNSTEFKERTAGYNYTLAGIDYNWISKSNNYYDFGGARVTFLVWGFGNVTTKGEAFNLDSQMRIKSIFEYNADNPPAGYYTDRCMGGCPDMINKTKPQCCSPPYVPKTLDTPLKQFKSGIPVEDVKCKPPLILFLKQEDKSPVCLTLDTSDKLLKLKWLTPPPYRNIIVNKTRDFVTNSATFKTFGINSTLFVDNDFTCILTDPLQCLNQAFFDGTRSGYGTGINPLVPENQIIHHNVAIRTINTNQIQCAVVDGVWDELNQKPLEKNDTTCGWLYGFKGGLP